MNKSYGYILIAAFGIAAAVCSCGKEESQNLDNDLILSVTRDRVPYYTDGENKAFSLNWKLVGDKAEVAANYVQFASDAESMDSFDMENSFLYEVRGASHDVLYSDIKSMKDCFGKNSDFALMVRLICDTKDGRTIYSNTVTVNILIDNTPSIRTMYLCGMAHSAGWTMSDDLGNRLLPVNNEVLDIYTWTGNLSSGGTFRFNTQRDAWFPAIVIDKRTGLPVYVSEWDESLYDQFTVQKDGTYHVEVDIRDLNRISVSVEPAD